jgi:hypothetical protein
MRDELNKTGEPPIEAVKNKISATEQPLTEIVAVRRYAIISLSNADIE